MMRGPLNRGGLKLYVTETHIMLRIMRDYIYIYIYTYIYIYIYIYSFIIITIIIIIIIINTVIIIIIRAREVPVGRVLLFPGIAAYIVLCFVCFFYVLLYHDIVLFCILCFSVSRLFIY